MRRLLVYWEFVKCRESNMYCAESNGKKKQFSKKS